MGNYRLLGQMLLNKKKITSEQLDEATRLGHSRGRRIGEALVALGYVTEWDVAECLAEQFDFDVVDPGKLTPDEYALSLLPPEVAIQHKVLMLKCSRDMVECVMSDPIDFPTSDMISKIVGRRTSIRLAPASVLVAAIKRAYGLLGTEDEVGAPPPQPRTPKPPRPPKDRDAILAQMAVYGDVLDKAVCVRVLAGGHCESEGVEEGVVHQ